MGEEGIVFLKKELNKMFTSGILSSWRLSEVTQLFEGNGSILECSNYRGIKLISHTFKLVISVIFIQIIECSDNYIRHDTQWYNILIYVCMLHECSTLTICWMLSLFICSQLAHSHLNRWYLSTPAQPQNLHAHSSLTK